MSDFFVDNPPNKHPLDSLYAVLSVDNNGEGICAAVIGFVGSTPLVTGSRTVGDQFFAIAREMQPRFPGKALRLVRYARAETIVESGP
jgi:hypothetical protein